MLLKNLSLRHLMKCFSKLYATRWFTIMLTAPSHRSDFSHMNPVHILPLYFFKFCINVILRPMLRFSNRFTTCRYLNKFFALVFRPTRATFPVHFLWINHTNKPSRGVKFEQSKLGPSPRYEGVYEEQKYSSIHSEPRR